MKEKVRELWALFKLWRKWKKIKSGGTVIDLTQCAGYFFPVGLINYNPLEAMHLIKMQSGKLMRASLLRYETYDNPADMIEEADYQFIGYENETDFAKMDWPEYRSMFYAVTTD